MCGQAAGAVMAHGWKLKHVSLMRLVCFETARMEAVRIQQLPYLFQRLPLNVHGNLPISEVCFLYCIMCKPTYIPSIGFSTFEKAVSQTASESELLEACLMPESGAESMSA